MADSSTHGHGGSSIRSRPGRCSFFDLDDILASQEKIPCTFETQVMDLGFLDHSSETKHLEAGTKMELPFWLAKQLGARQRNFVSVELPKVYRESYRQIMEADATVVDLNKLGPHFYLFGSKLLEFGTVENPRVAESLIMTYTKRVRKIMDLSQNNLHESNNEFLPKLDKVEHNIFKNGQKSLLEFEQWKQGLIAKLSSSKSVTNHRKRKRTEEN